MMVGVLGCLACALAKMVARCLTAFRVVSLRDAGTAGCSSESTAVWKLELRAGEGLVVVSAGATAR